MSQALDNHLDTNGMPSNIAAERALLGSIMLENSICDESSQIIGSDDFAIESHRLIFRAMEKLSRENRTIDLVTVADSLGTKVERIGGIAVISSLIDGVPHQCSGTEYAKIVLESSRARSIITAANNAAMKAMDGEGADAVLATLQEQISEQVSRGMKRTSQSLHDIGREWLNELYTVRKMSRDGFIGLTTGIHALDQTTTGIRRHELWVIGARPAVGKSAFARQVAMANARLGKKVVLFTIEMTATQQLSCAVASASGGQIPFFKLRDPRYLTEEQLKQVGELTAEICNLSIVFDETGNLSANEFMARARLHASRGADLFIVDYLQRMRGEPRQSTLERVAAASNAVCELAKSTGVPVLALSQLRKALNGQEDREPTADDLKETSEIYQDAATVILLHRPMNEAVTSVTSRPAVLLMPKQRFGDSDVRMELVFDKRTLSFKEVGS